MHILTSTAKAAHSDYRLNGGVGNYGNTGYYGVTTLMLYQTQLVPDGALPNQNRGWNKIK